MRGINGCMQTAPGAAIVCSRAKHRHGLHDTLHCSFMQILAVRQAGPDITVSYLPNIASKEEADLHFTITMDSTEARAIHSDIKMRRNERRRRPLKTANDLVQS